MHSKQHSRLQTQTLYMLISLIYYLLSFMSIASSTEGFIINLVLVSLGIAIFYYPYIHEKCNYGLFSKMALAMTGLYVYTLVSVTLISSGIKYVNGEALISFTPLLRSEIYISVKLLWTFICVTSLFFMCTFILIYYMENNRIPKTYQKNADFYTGILKENLLRLIRDLSDKEFMKVSDKNIYVTGPISSSKRTKYTVAKGCNYSTPNNKISKRLKAHMYKKFLMKKIKKCSQEEIIGEIISCGLSSTVISHILSKAIEYLLTTQHDSQQGMNDAEHHRI